MNRIDRIIITRCFTPVGPVTRYAAEYDPDGREFFGHTAILGEWDEGWGLSSINDLTTHLG